VIRISSDKKLQADGFLTPFGSAAVHVMLADQGNFGQVGVGRNQSALGVEKAKVLQVLDRVKKVVKCHIVKLR